MPSGCCRCGTPATQQLKTTIAVRGFGSNKTRSVEVPYCGPCATRGRKIQRARLALYGCAIAVAALVSGFGLLAPFLPRAAIIVVPVVLAVMTAVVLRQRAGDGVERPWGAWLVKGTNKDSTFFCTHAEWTQQFAAANGVEAVSGSTGESVMPWIGALLVAAGAATFVSYAVRPSIHIDNGGAQPVQVWIDGKKSIVVQPAISKNDERPTVEVPIGAHVFGWSKVDASAPAGQTAARKIEWLGDHLYNPESTSCYWIDVSKYGSASTKGMAHGPQTLDELYTFSHIDNWFHDNPTSISTKSSGETRTAVNTIAACAELTANGCSVEVRRAFVTCAQGVQDKPGWEACVSDAAQACAAQAKQAPRR
jgi:hypothetical protein